MLKFLKNTTFVLLLASTFYAQAQKPTPVCFSGLAADLIPTTGTVTISAESFDAGSYDKVGGKIQLRLQVPAPSLGTAFDSTKVSKTFTFDCVGLKSVALWVGNEAGIWDFCTTYIDIQNNMNAPNVPNCTPYIGNGDCTNGKIFKLDIRNPLNCPRTTPFNIYIDGLQAFIIKKWNSATYCAPLNSKVDYVFNGLKENLLNGVSTLDLVIISKHILGVKPITNNFYKIAADVNNNGAISTSDLVDLRKAILGLSNSFPNNESWKIIPKENYPANVSLLTYKFGKPFGITLTSDTTMRFNLVKIGDVSDTMKCTTSAPRGEIKNHFFELEDKKLAVGENYTLSLSSKELEGFQFTLKYDEDALELVSLDENSNLKSNSIISSQLQGEEFKATFKVKKEISVSEAISLNSSRLQAEGYANNDLYSLDFKFNSKENNSFELLQNQPNPSNGNTVISFKTQSEGNYSVSIYDVTGRNIKTINAKAVVGLNSIPVSMEEKGVYFYELLLNGQKAIKKMIVE